MAMYAHNTSENLVNLGIFWTIFFFQVWNDLFYIDLNTLNIIHEKAWPLPFHKQSNHRSPKALEVLLIPAERWYRDDASLNVPLGASNTLHKLWQSMNYYVGHILVPSVSRNNVLSLMWCENDVNKVPVSTEACESKSEICVNILPNIYILRLARDNYACMLKTNQSTEFECTFCMHLI